MSLINQMLQDLEKRGEDTASAGEQYLQMGSAHRVQPANRFKVFGLSLLLVLAVGLGYFYMTRETHKPLVNQTPEPKANLAPLREASASAIPEAQDGKMAAMPLKLALEFDTRKLKSTDIGASTNKPEEKSSPETAKDKSSVTPALMEIKRNTVETSSSLLKADKSSTANPSLNTASATGLMVKEITPQQRAEGEYKQASIYLQQGRINEGITALEQVLKTDPVHAPARQLLVSTLLENHRQEEALQELKTGIALDPSQINLVMLLARLQLERAKPNEAIETLQASLAMAKERPDYWAFLAGLLQKVGRNKEAAQHYRNAVKMNPNNGVWWMGLGISLQADAANNEALEAYQQALTRSGLSAELRSYIEQKTAQLQK